MHAKQIAGFTSRLRQARTEMEFTHAELSRITGITERYLVSLEAGRPDEEDSQRFIAYERICKALVISEEWLLHGRQSSISATLPTCRRALELHLTELARIKAARKRRRRPNFSKRPIH